MHSCAVLALGYLLQAVWAVQRLSSALPRPTTTTIIDVDAQTICSYDRLRVHWSLNFEELSSFSHQGRRLQSQALWLQLQRSESNSTMHREQSRQKDWQICTSLPLPIREQLDLPDCPHTSHTDCAFKQPIQSDLHPLEPLKIHQLQLDADTHTLNITFTQPTNQVTLPALSDWLSCFDTGDLADQLQQLQEELSNASTMPYSSCWSTPATLTTQLPSNIFDMLYRFAPILGLSLLSIRPPSCPTTTSSGNMTLRIATPGSYRLQLVYQAENRTFHPVSRLLPRSGTMNYISPEWQARDCADIVVQERIGPHIKPAWKHTQTHAIHSSSNSPSVSPTPSSHLPPPSLQVPGTLSLSGTQGLTLAHTSLPGQDVGSWSMMLWLMLLEDSTGQYRTLFYKGDGQTQRTPSAWLLPHSRRLTLRLSTERNPDLGMNTMTELPLMEWVHVAFVFAGDQESIELLTQEKDVYTYVVAVYLDGRPDGLLRYQLPVSFNEQPFTIGHDGTHSGPRSMVKAVQLYDVALTNLQVQKLAANQTRPKSLYRHHRMWSTFLSVEGLRLPFSEQQSCARSTESQVDDRLMPSEDQRWQQLADNARKRCAPISERLHYLKQAAKSGSAHAAYRAGMLLLVGDEYTPYGQGSTSPDNVACPRALEKWSSERTTHEAIKLVGQATEGNISPAQPILAFLLLAGVGVGRYVAEAFPESDAQSRTGSMPVYGQDVGNAVFDVLQLREDDLLSGNATPSATRWAMELLHVAAVDGSTEAQMALGIRYQHGLGVEQDLITASFFLCAAAEVASVHYHTKGQEPQHEDVRLSDETVSTVDQGQRGENDAQLQYIKLRAKEGDTNALNQMGDLYYWGIRGVRRDQGRAREYFDRAAAAGNEHGMCLAAAMYLKGEGGAKNHTHAVQLYEKAAQHNNVQALNGLGYAYFSGESVPQNLTLARHFFLRAAKGAVDGDSLHNAAHCLEHGLGGPVDLAEAAVLYQQAAVSFGHFAAAHRAGTFHYLGRGVPQDFQQAVRYLRPAATFGPWGRYLRTAFNAYLDRDFLSSYLLYVFAAELGYHSAQSNAAWLLRRKLDPLQVLGQNSAPEADLLDSGLLGSIEAPRVKGQCRRYAKDPKALRRRLTLRHDYLSWKLSQDADACLHIGDAHYYGCPGLEATHSLALYWYMTGSAQGHAHCSYNSGYMFETGQGTEALTGRAGPDLQKAERYYRYALGGPTVSSSVAVVCQLAILRVRARKLLLRLSLHRWVRVSQPPKPAWHPFIPATDDGGDRQNNRGSKRVLSFIRAARRQWHASVEDALFRVLLDSDISSVLLILSTACLLLALLLWWVQRGRRKARRGPREARTMYSW